MNKSYVEIELRLNMQMIVDDLEDEYEINNFSRYQDKQRLRGACIYFGQKDLNPCFVYVARTDVFKKYPVASREISIVSIGELPVSVKEKCGSYIEVDGNTVWESVFNTVQSIFSRYFIWAQRLSHILSGGGSVYELCVAAIDFFQNPLYVHDANFNVVAMPQWVVGMTDFIVDESGERVTIPLRKIHDFQNNPEYIKTLSTYGAKLWNPDYISRRVIYVNLWSKNGEYYGRFLINELNSSFKPGQFVMAEYFAKFLVAAFEQNLVERNSSNTFELILQNIFRTNSLDEALVLNRLKMIRWKRDDRYICMAAQMANVKNPLISGRKISSMIGMVLKKSFSFITDDTVYTVCNLRDSGYEENDCHVLMRKFCDDSDMVMGISNVFGDFFALREYYHQAVKAITLGQQYSPEKRCHVFSEHVLDYIIWHFTAEFTVESVCSSAVNTLYRIDREKNTEYIKTLKTYLNNGCQQTITAEEMFIHRSTLLYRLGKISEMTGVDLNDTDTRLYLQISLKLAEKMAERPE